MESADPIDVDIDMWARKKRVYAQQLAERLEGDAAFRASFEKTMLNVRAIHKLSLDYERRRVAENRMFGLSCASLGLVLIECLTDAGWIRYVNALLTALLLVLLVSRYSIQREIYVGKGISPPNVRLYELPASLVLSFAVEFVVCSIFLPPGFEGTFTMWQWIMAPASHGPPCPFGGTHSGDGCYFVFDYDYQVLGLFVFLRMYMVPRFIRNLSDFYSSRIAFVGSLNNVDALGVLFSIKYMLRTRPFPLLVVGFTATLLTVSAALVILEAPVNPAVSTYSNAMWLTVVTMATVGYGDRVPMTIPGQVLMVLGAMATGILFAGILSASFFALLDLTERDRNVFNLLSNEKEAKATSLAAARLIQAAWNHYQCRRREATPVAVANAASVLLYAAAQTARKLRKSKKLSVPSLTDQLRDEFAGLHALATADHEARRQRLVAMEADLDASLARAHALLPA
ncbi:hypothetical protein SPRG_13353 [Saprolegnia parasitica CBS 223.65]|uniref:Potassium channel domain-containing protein n=1 Tax=Saprolegnia parasitica (strain CBS 223.65) TaxID=695850 RepID=A0A067BTF5_SAPPC|nr:hypothetical protein SPRG_13353 [Saprolegnia parasitica CBS 223.65]KDO21543.1 hypothetical protein SPRG_13353 [Saprolegnia parasitica CBS 223.65]|eukprot:XP_012207721.1 hypothetical protein SPRG_13353 [Saprolegnia parasitica CBS 223.65]